MKNNLTPKTKALEILKLYNPNGIAPFPYTDIVVDRRDIDIRWTATFDNKFFGSISYLKDKDSFIILVNKNNTVARQNFTIAHELGHYFLHDHLLKKGYDHIDGVDSLEDLSLFSSTENINNKEEKEANKFAMELIMPDSLVSEIWHKINNIEECAKIFVVPTVIMVKRLEELSLLGN